MRWNVPAVVPQNYHVADCITAVFNPDPVIIACERTVRLSQRDARLRGCCLRLARQARRAYAAHSSLGKRPHHRTHGLDRTARLSSKDSTSRRAFLPNLDVRAHRLRTWANVSRQHGLRVFSSLGTYPSIYSEWAKPKLAGRSRGVRISIRLVRKIGWGYLHAATFVAYVCLAASRNRRSRCLTSPNSQCRRLTNPY